MGSLSVLVQLGAVGVFAAGVAARDAGAAAPWYVLAAVLVGFAVRGVDLEASALFLPGGAYGAARHAFGRPTAIVAASLLLLDDVLLGVLAAGAAGHALTGRDDPAVVVGVCLIGVVWWWCRQGRTIAIPTTTRVLWTAVAVVALTIAVGAVSAAWHPHARAAVAALPFTSPASLRLAGLTAFAGVLFVVGSPDAFTRAIGEFPPPRVARARRALAVVNAWALFVTLGLSLLFVALVPAGRNLGRWADAPLMAVALFSGVPRALTLPLGVAAECAAAALLAWAVYGGTLSAQRLLLRLAEDGIVPRSMRELHERFGTPSRLIDIAALTQVAVLIAVSGQVAWLARVYGIVIAGSLLLKVAALVRLRALRLEPRAFRVPLNVRIAGRELPLGLLAVGTAVGVPALWLTLTADGAAVTGVGLVAATAAVLIASERAAHEPEDHDGPADDVELLHATVGAEHLQVAPGSLLVPVRKPGALAPLAGALRAAGTREVVVMTVRLAGVDASEERLLSVELTDDERRLFLGAALMAERQGRVVRLLIVPARGVFDAVAATAARLRVSDIHVGESETLAADDQARRLGDAWERADVHEPVDVRLVVHHSSGRSAVYHLGAHAPALTTEDLHLLHKIWLDVTNAIGPHVHHRDVVRAALTHMQEQLSHPGPERDAALDGISRTAQAADELAAVVRQRDFGRLRDMVRNRPESDIAAALTGLSVEDQVVAFRVLPRRTAAATFEYLSHDAQQALLKAMAQEDVAAILNEMAPDDRTTFLEELPAAATQQLLALLTPEERAVAVTLLGYPEGSIGRRMTPDYIAVREQWTVQDVLDYIRTHGQDSETLNVIYVVDEHGVLVDDIRIRECLLTSPASRVADLMDRRFVSLNAADDENTAVAVFRREDRTALPVTDSAGVLIGIVTIDDVLDVVEAKATEDLQRVGGSEALDEPYMRIAMPRMIQKRAGWLTALFLGEMLTATAMGFFEKEIERAVVLALFVPLIISSGGNSGSQASTLVIRALALGEVQLKDWWRVARREIAAGLALGAILGCIGFLRITIWSAFSTLYGEHWMLVAVTVALALVGVVLWGTLIGSLLPLVLRRMGFDPATSSAPFVATLVDVTGLVIYFSVGLLVLHSTLLRS